MSEYKLYFLRDNDRVIDVVRLSCVDDDEALALMDGNIQHHAVELWQEHRFLVRANRSAPFGGPSRHRKLGRFASSSCRDDAFDLAALTPSGKTSLAP